VCTAQRPNTIHLYGAGILLPNAKKKVSVSRLSLVQPPPVTAKDHWCRSCLAARNLLRNGYLDACGAGNLVLVRYDVALPAGCAAAGCGAGKTLPCFTRMVHCDEPRPVTAFRLTGLFGLIAVFGDCYVTSSFRAW